MTNKKPTGVQLGKRAKTSGNTPQANELTAFRAKTEQNLREEKDFTAAVLDTAGALVVVLDKQGRITRFNHECERITGYASCEVLGRVFWEFLIPQEELEGVRQTWETLRAGDFPNTHENHWVAKNGSRCLIAWANTAILQPDGEIDYLIGTGIDITERKRSEEAIRRAATRFEILSDTAAKLLESKNPQDIVNTLCGRVMEFLDCHIFINYLVDEPAHRLHLNASGGLPKKTARAIEWLDFGQAICGRVAQEGKRIVAEDIQESCDTRADLVRSIGITAYACHPIMTQGQVIGTLSFGTTSRKSFNDDDLATMKAVADYVATAMERMRAEETVRRSRDELEKRIGERTAELHQTVDILQQEAEQRIVAEKAIRAERKRFEDLLEMMPAYAILLTPDYRVAYANRTFRKWFGNDRGKKCYEFLFNRTEPCDSCQTYTVLKTGQFHYWEWTGPNGRHYDIYDYPFTDTDGAPLIMEIGVDVTAHKQAQEALNLTAMHIRGLIEASLDPLVTISPEGKITDVNKATELATGLSRVRLINTDFSDYFTEPDKAREGYKKVLSEGQVRDYPLTIRHVSDHQTDVLYNAAVYKDKAGQIQGVFAAARDVTELNRAQLRSRITNVLLELFAQKSERKEYLDSVVSVIRDWSGCECVGIRLVNDNGFIPYESCVGFTEKFLSVENTLSLKNDACLCIRAITQTIEPPDISLATPKGSFCCNNTFEFVSQLTEQENARYRGNCIKYGFASLAVVPIRYRDKIIGAIHLVDPEEGKTPPEAVEFLENIAMLVGEAVHRFDMETALRQSEERYRQLVEASPDGIGVERGDRIVFINTAGAKLLGYTGPEELIGTPIFDFVHPDIKKCTRSQLRNLRQKKISLPTREEKFVRADGSIFDVQVAATPLIYQNMPATQILFSDITERKRTQEKILSDQKQLRLLTAELTLTEERERREIATDLHDSIGPLLAFVKMELKTLQKSAPETISQPLRDISDKITEAIQQTRTLSFDLSPSILYEIGFEAAVEDLVDKLSKERNIQSHFETCQHPKPLTDDVKVLLYRSVRELMINMVKHANARCVKVTLLRSNSDIHITVEDDGRGFDMSHLIGGSKQAKGFGLFSIRERLSHIGGQFQIESVVNKGTKVVLIAPLDIEREEKNNSGNT